MVKMNQLEQWQERVARQERSGLSVTDYCRRNNLVTHQMVYWRGRIRKLNQSQGRFVEKSRQSQPVEVQIGERIKIVVGSDYDAKVVKSLVELLSDAKV